MTRPFTHALALLPCLMIASVASAAEKAPWVWAGSYVYEHDGGRTVGGSPIVVTYRLDIAPGRGNRDCVLRIEGFQTNETIVCKAAGTVDSIMVSFPTFGDGRIVNASGTRLYDVGTNLFEIRRVGEAVSTQWRALNPSGAGSSVPAGTSFARKG